MNLEGVIFDLDGTLADTLPVCYAAFRSALASYSDREYTDQEIHGFFGPTEEGIIRRLVPNDWEAGLRLYLEAYERAHDTCPIPFAGIETALQLLREQGIALGVVTGKGPASAAISLKRLGLESYFDVVEAGAAEGPIKPASIRQVLARWSLSPSQIVYVGDAPSDIDAARQAGVAAIGAAWARPQQSEALKARAPLAVFDRVDCFVAWIEETTRS
jgi:pyrophosphatase PpaX